MFRKYIFLVLLLIISVLPRLIFLDKVPAAINEDELHYVIDAKSFFFTGKDTLGQVTPFDVLLFNSPKSLAMQAELQYFLEIPIFGLFGFSMFNLVFMNSVMSVLTVLLIYLIALKLFNKYAALFAGLIAAINPWLIFSGRTTYEAGPATLFFLCIFYVLLFTKGWKILFVIPVALLAFYSYIGTKLIFLPFMFLIIAYTYLYVNKKKYLKQYLLLLLFSIFITLFFAFQFSQHGGARTTELLFPNNPEIARQVVLFRGMAIQSPFINLFDNKISIYLMVLTKNMFNTFSSSYLFSNADYFFMLGGHGLFYYLDSIFLFIGLAWLLMKDKKLFALFTSLILLATVPQIFHDPNGNGNFTPHISLFIPLLIILIGLGIEQVFKQFKKKKYLYLSIGLIGALYAFAFISFLYFYFFKFPLQEATFEVQNRILSKYISLYGNKVPITVYSTNPKLSYREFIFYTDSYNVNTAASINRALRDERFVFKNISFVPCESSELKNSNSLVIDDISCTRLSMLKAVRIVQLKDGGLRYNIYNDSICGKFDLSSYVSNLKLSDLNIENSDTQKFCKTYIISR